MKERLKNSSMNRGGGDAVYGLGFIGALIYYFQNATNFWMVLVGIFKAFFWPAFLVHALLGFLKM
ncbi:hypothetical protein IT414_01385 [bacterium]|nr:hypothetical protein [bacterium]